MKKFFNKLINKKTKIMIGKKVRIIKTPSGKQSSNFRNEGREMYVVSKNCSFPNAWLLSTSPNGHSVGFAYDYEMEVIFINLETIEQELLKKQLEVETIKDKIKWMKEAGVAEFNEDQFKVYQTLKLLDNNDLSTLEKSKLIAELIKK
jgi:hypothetical protein